MRVVGPAGGCPAATETTRGVEIVLAHGRTVRGAGFDRQTLAEVLAVLEAPTVLNLSELVRIYVCLTPTDMRNYVVTVIMRSWAAGDAEGGDRA